MESSSRFPNSARAKWLAKRSRRPAPLPPEAREVRALAKALTLLLPTASKDQLRDVARILGKSGLWFDMVCMEARNPGVVGKACLKAVR